MVLWSGITYKVKYKWRKFKIAVSRMRYQAMDMLVYYIPSDQIRDLPKTQALPLGLVALVLVISASSFLFYITFIRLVENSYLALSADSGSTCVDVLRSMNNEYYSKYSSSHTLTIRTVEFVCFVDDDILYIT
jgi:hypothetical protein